jgi:kinesin family protein C1
MVSGLASKPTSVTKSESVVKTPVKGAETSANDDNNNVNNKVDAGKDFDKSWMIAQDIIKLHKERETQYMQQIMTLNTEKSQLEKSKQELQQMVSQLERKTHEMELQISDLKHNAQLNGEKHNYTIELHMKDLVHKHEVEMNDLERRYKEELDLAVKDIKREAKEVIEREQESFQSRLDTKEKEFQERLQQEQEASRSSLESANKFHNERETSLNYQQAQLEKEVKRLRNDNQNWANKFSAIENEMKLMKADLSKHQTEAATGFSRYESEIRQLQLQIKEKDENLADQKNRLTIAKAEEKLAKEKLFLAETVRRKLHSQLQELKGNIRVFCRVRPLLEDESSPVAIIYPDIKAEGQQLQIVSNNGDSDSTTRIHSFSFDKVFDPSAPNQTVFEEVSNLVQSALDGFNVCIFAYGQTGSGKTFTMSSSKTGVIPLAVSQIFNTAERLQELNWEYKFQGEFLEIYNERIIDLLKPQDDLDNNTVKYEIRHDTAARSTTVTGLTSIPLSTPVQANEVLERASRNRSVAATLANERSSRSHSVFILRLVGHNKETGETRTGVLNLIDLAGSERLTHSQAVGDRLKETQAINRSLSSLGDVICALGNSNALHIPYRNSKVCG